MANIRDLDAVSVLTLMSLFVKALDAELEAQPGIVPTLANKIGTNVRDRVLEAFMQVSREATGAFVREVDPSNDRRSPNGYHPDSGQAF